MDKTFLIIFLLILSAGVTAYDRYQVNRGEISPVGKLLDFAGIARNEDAPETRVRRDTSAYRLTLQDNIAELRRKHQEVQQKRSDYLDRRYAILDQLNGLNDQVNQESLKYADVLNEEREGFMAYFPRIEQIRALMVQSEKPDEPGIDRAKYRQMKEDIHHLLSRISSQPRDDYPNIYSALERMDAMADGRADILAADCPQGQAACLSAKAEQLSAEVRGIVENSIDKPAREIHALIELTKQISREYRILTDNLKNSEVAFIDTGDRIMDLFQGILRDVVTASDEDIRKLEALYAELQEHQKILLNNIELSRQRVEEVHVEMDRKIDDINRDWITLNEGFEVYPQKLRQARDDRRRLMGELQTNELQVRELMHEQWQQDEEIMTSLTDSVEEDLKRLKEERDYAQRQYENSIGGKLDRMRTRISGTASDSRSHQQRQNTSIDRSMQRLRDRAQDQGF